MNSHFFSALWWPVIILLVTPLLIANDADDPVLEYYWNKASQRTAELDPAISEVRFTCTVRSYYHHVSSNGEILRTDTLVTCAFYTGGGLDSTKTLKGDSEHFPEAELVPPNVFAWDYHCHLFPNDTGGRFLPIGLLADSAAVELPDGLMILDRYGFYPHRLYLCYPKRGNFKRLTRSFRYVLVDELLFPDSVWEVGTRVGIFNNENYRLETAIFDIHVYR